MAAGAPSNVTTNTKDWISLAQRIQAIAQTGLAYATGPYDVERYQELSAIAASMIAGPEPERIALAAELFAAEQGYATPRVDVRAAVFDGNRLLLVRCPSPEFCPSRSDSYSTVCAIPKPQPHSTEWPKSRRSRRLGVEIATPPP
jgi:hypothetical protein